MSRIKLHDKEFTPYIDSDKITQSIKALASRMEKDLAGKTPVFLGILNGSFMFVAELMKNLKFDCEISFIKVSSYAGTGSTGDVKTLVGINESLKDRTVVIVEDIVDTGLTIEILWEMLKEHQPKEVMIATLLLKPNSYKKPYPVKYVCLEVPDEFLVGYGLDYNGLGRNLDHICKIV